MDGWKNGCRRAALSIVVWLGGASVALAQSSLPAPWVGQDIGSPLIAGSSTLAASAILTVKASGSDIWGTSDQFHFVYLPISGNVDVRARVDAIAPTAVWAK